MSSEPNPRWSVDLDWLEQNNRSFFILAQGCLCPKCREQRGGDTQRTSVEVLSHLLRNERYYGLRQVA